MIICQCSRVTTDQIDRAVEELKSLKKPFDFNDVLDHMDYAFNCFGCSRLMKKEVDARISTED